MTIISRVSTLTLITTLLLSMPALEAAAQQSSANATAEAVYLLQSMPECGVRILVQSKSHCFALVLDFSLTIPHSETA